MRIGCALKPCCSTDTAIVIGMNGAGHTRIETNAKSRIIRLQIAKTVLTCTLQIVSHFCKHRLRNEPVVLKMVDE